VVSDTEPLAAAKVGDARPVLFKEHVHTAASQRRDQEVVAVVRREVAFLIVAANATCSPMNSTLDRQVGLVTARSEALLTKHPFARRSVCVKPRGSSAALAASSWWRARVAVMVNTREHPIKVVITDGPKVLVGPNQNGMRTGTGTCCFPVMGVAPPAERVDLKRMALT
jgi:hypothetical protein